MILGEDLVWHTVRGMGWRVPQDVGFISVDWSPEYSEIGGFNQRHETHGSVAVDLVVAQLLKNERGLPAIPRWVLVKGEWTDGASVPPAAERTAARMAVLMLSGYARGVAPMQLDVFGRVAFLGKPFDLAVLLREVQRLLCV